MITVLFKPIHFIILEYRQVMKSENSPNMYTHKNIDQKVNKK